MNPQLAHLVVEQSATVKRIAEVLLRDVSELDTAIQQHIQLLTSTKPDSVAFIDGVNATLDSLEGSAVPSDVAGLRQRLLDQYQLDNSNREFALANALEEAPAHQGMAGVEELIPMATHRVATAAETDAYNRKQYLELYERTVRKHLNPSLLAAVDEGAEAMIENTIKTMVFHYTQKFDALSPADKQATLAGTLGEALRAYQTSVEPMPVRVAVAGAAMLEFANRLGEVRDAVEKNRGVTTVYDVLTKHLSPEVFTGGRGLINQKRCKWESYTSGLGINPNGPSDGLATVVNWPTGWYGCTGDEDHPSALLIHLPDHSIVAVDHLTSNQLLPQVRIALINGAWLAQDELSVGEALRISQQLDSYLSELPVDFTVK